MSKGQPKTYGPVYFESAYFDKHTMHWHEHLQLILVLEGMVHLKIGYESIDLKARDMMLINSNEIHSIESTDDPTKVLFLYLDFDYVQQAYPGFYEAVASCPFRRAFEQTKKKRGENSTVILNWCLPICKIVIVVLKLNMIKNFPGQYGDCFQFSSTAINRH